jgi:hypothetical protein
MQLNDSELTTKGKLYFLNSPDFEGENSLTVLN